MTLEDSPLQERIASYWSEATTLVKDIAEDELFNTPVFLKQVGLFLSNYFPSVYKPANKSRKWEPYSKTKAIYLRDQEVLHPVKTKIVQRFSWSYTKKDIIRVIVVERLKNENVNVREIKGWLQSFEAESASVTAAPNKGIAKDFLFPDRTSVQKAYLLLRKRLIGALVIALSTVNEEAIPNVESPANLPPRSIILFRTVNENSEKSTTSPDHMNLDTIKKYMTQGHAFLAATDRMRKVYLYDSTDHLLDSRVEIKNHLSNYQWFNLGLKDETNRYEVIIAVTEEERYLNPSTRTLIDSIETLREQEFFVPLVDKTVNRNLHGLASLLQAAFIKPINISKSSTLEALAQIIASTFEGKGLDYCAILLPERLPNSGETELVVRAKSDNFPEEEPLNVKLGDFLSGWSYRYNHFLKVTDMQENDPRVTHFGTEVYPEAAIAVPASVYDGHQSRAIGVIYGGAKKWPNKGENITLETEYGLKAFGLICGDAIADNNIALRTVEGIGRLNWQPYHVKLEPEAKDEDESTFALGTFIEEAIKKIKMKVRPQSENKRFIYFITLNAHTNNNNEPFDSIQEWHTKQLAELATQYLIYETLKYPIPVAMHRIEAGKYVLALLEPVTIQEEDFKKQINTLQDQLSKMKIEGRNNDVVVWRLAFNFDECKRYLNDKSKMGARNPEALIMENLEGSVHINRGHMLLNSAALDPAITEFAKALMYSPNEKNRYVEKHIAEAYMLQAKYDKAIEWCEKALHDQEEYSSAHCLLADCLTFKKEYKKAINHYKSAIKQRPRADFYIRYGIALLNMTNEIYKVAGAGTGDTTTSCYIEALKCFEEALRLYEESRDSSERYQTLISELDYYRGCAFLQQYSEEAQQNTDALSNAISAFEQGRRHLPTSLPMIQMHAFAMSLKHGHRSLTVQPHTPSTDANKD